MHNDRLRVRYEHESSVDDTKGKGKHHPDASEDQLLKQDIENLEKPTFFSTHMVNDT